MKVIQFAGESFIPDPSGILIWPKLEIAIVADLHLEKATYFAQQGQLLPPQESYETLSNLWETLDRVKCRSLVLLGDSFHDANGFGRLDSRARKLWKQICSKYVVTFVVGNHDGAFVPPDTKGVDFLAMEGITFRHQAAPNAVGEVSGHYHPKASLRLRGNRITRPCFIVDASRIILPAFGTLTGGLNVESPEIKSLLLPDFTVHLLGESKIYPVPSHKLFQV